MQQASPKTSAASKKVSTLSEVVVTAERNGKKNAMRIPLSITAFNGDWIQQNGFAGIADFLQLAPGVSVVSGNAAASRIQIRGISTDIGESSVGYYIDNIPMSFINQVPLPSDRAFDLERVEVLRGPQGTLYGAGALGGVVRIITNPPVLNDYILKTDIGTSNTYSGGENYFGNFAVNLPLVQDHVSVRGVFTRTINSGWINYTTLGINNYNSAVTNTGRIEVLDKVNDNLSLNAVYLNQRVDQNGDPSADNHLNNAEGAMLPTSTNYNVFNFTADYHNDDFSIVNAISYMRQHQSLFDSLGSTADSSLLTGLNPGAFSEELRVFSTNSSVWQWVVGAYYRSITQTQLQAVGPNPFVPVVDQSDFVSTRNLYGQMTRHLLDDHVAVTVGGRILDDTRRSTSHLFTALAPYGATFRHFIPEVKIAYFPTPNWMAYFAYGQGFRDGVDQFAVVKELAESLGVVVPNTALPETADSYVLGTKGTFWNGRASLVADVYDLVWNNMQVEVPIVQNSFVATLNAKGAKSHGIELAFDVRPTRSLTFGLTASTIDAKVSAAVIAHAAIQNPETGELESGTVPIVVMNKGERLDDVPTFTWGLTARYETPITPDVAFSANMDAQYATARSAVNFTTETRGDNTFFLNARMGLQWAKWGLYLFGTNLSNNKANISPFFADLTGYGERAQPLTIGIELKYFFDRVRWQ